MSHSYLNPRSERERIRNHVETSFSCLSVHPSTHAARKVPKPCPTLSLQCIKPLSTALDRALEVVRSHNRCILVRPWAASTPLPVLDSPTPSQILTAMDDEYPFAAMHPTAGYLFAEELDAHFLALDDFHAMLLEDDIAAPKVTAMSSTFSPSTSYVSPSSPSSVVYLPPCYPPVEGFDDYEPVIKQEPLPFTAIYNHEEVFIKSEPIQFDYVVNSYLQSANGEDKERLRQRQRGYEKKYRSRKRRELKAQREVWLSLEMKLDDTRKKHCRPYAHLEQGGRDSLRYKLLQLKLEERALRQDQVAMRSLQSWEQISRIREYSDKHELRTMTEWCNSADKVIGCCAILGPRRFHPYAPVKQHFTW